ncbi:unnamed protein product [Musa acuminata var. zebrina]
MAMSPRTAALHGVAPLPRLRLPSLTSCGSRRVNVRAKVEPSEKSVEIMRKFSEQYARKSETYFCIDKGVTSVVIKGLADHKDMLGAPLCPCRHYDDKAAEVAQGFWNCPCVPMRERKECHCMLFLNPDNDFAGKEQVVKRARPISDGSHCDDDMPSLASKLSVRERLENNMANSSCYGSQYENKRQRTDDHDSRFMNKNPRDKHIKSNHHVRRDDLRWKLINKSLSRRRHPVAEGQYDVDLREKLSQNTRASRVSDPQQHTIESRTSGFGRRIPSTRSADDLLELDSHRKSYSWTLDQQRRSSPDRLISAPRRISPSRRYEELKHTSVIRSVDASRTSFLTNSGVGDSSRSFAFMTKNTSANAVKPVVRAPAPGDIGQRIVLKPEEPLTVSGLLHSLGLGKYAVLFQAEEVDMTALRQMGDNDLKELGIPMGPRKKILLAVLSQEARHPQRQR